MAFVRKRSKNGLSVTAYIGDAKTLLAFNFDDKKNAKNLAGFTIQCEPDGQQPYYLQNSLQFERPADHAQDAKEPANSSINAPFHKFRWLHIPGSVHQGVKPFYGKYTYRVTPRYFDPNHSMTAVDPDLTVSIDVSVAPFKKDGIELGFTRGFTQSQAFVHHFGLKALIRPKNKELIFDTSQESGTNAEGQTYTFEDEYEWLGFTAHQKIAALLDEVVKDKSLRLDVLAYDLNEPQVVSDFVTLAKQNRIRLILDNAALHHNKKKPKPEDQVEQLFIKAKKTKLIKRGKISRYQHDKIFIVHKGNTPIKVLTGSTNFSVTGLYVNSNHVLIFHDADVVEQYAKLFEAVWDADVTRGPLLKLPLSTQTFSFKSPQTPQTEITFAPHSKAVTEKILGDLAARIDQEGKKAKTIGSVLFAVMELDNGTSPVYTALNKVHENQRIFSYGISDNPKGIYLHAPGKKTGVLVTGKPASTVLPPPFDQVPNIGVGHQVHHKFVVCGFNTDDPVVYCGSSNLALGGEQANGDNLLAIHDPDIATAFAIEAMGMVDHFQFLDGVAHPKKKGAKTTKKPVSKKQAAVDAGWFLKPTDKWTQPYFDSKDLKSIDRLLFAK